MSETKELALVEKETTGAMLVTNIDEVEAFVAEKLAEYTPENYTGDADAAKKDRATLNNSKKALSAKRLEIIKAAMDRFGIAALETRCKKVEKDIDTASLALDAIVKIKEEAEKETKRLNIELYYKSKKFDLVPLSRLFDVRWLNKGAKLKDVQAELDDKIESVYSGIKTIEAFGVDVDTLKPLFLESLDIGKTIEQGNRIKENRERLAREESERKEREAAQKKAQAEKELEEEIKQEEKVEPVASLVSEALGKPVDDDPEMTYTLRFKARRSVLFALRKYMLDNGIEYDKVEES